MSELSDLHRTLMSLREDVSAIRNGNFDPPTGSYPGDIGTSPTLEDVVDELKDATRHLGEISNMLWLLGLQAYEGNWNEDVQKFRSSEF